MESQQRIDRLRNLDMPLTPDWLKAWPHLREADFETISPATVKYNCVAWAAGNAGRWWWPVGKQSYWPPGVPRSRTLAAFAQAYAALGYQPCPDDALESAYEKIAIYVNGLGRPTHVALQLDDGRWTSKLGKMVDITHVSLACLEGELYGKVAMLLRRRHA